MQTEALYPKPNTSKPSPGHKIYSYLLWGVTVDRLNQDRAELQVKGMDITDVPTARGFVYLAAVVDWYARQVLTWRFSITMETSFCVEALKEALDRHSKPDIFNIDQGSQFIGQAFSDVVLAAGIAIGIDRKGAWRDNVIVGRLWRSAKYEKIYLRSSDPNGRYLARNNGRRPNSSLDPKTPDQAYFDRLLQTAAARTRQDST